MRCTLFRYVLLYNSVFAIAPLLVIATLDHNVSDSDAPRPAGDGRMPHPPEVDVKREDLFLVD